MTSSPPAHGPTVPQAYPNTRSWTGSAHGLTHGAHGPVPQTGDQTMKLSTKNDPIFVHYRRISHREDLRFNLAIARRHIAQCHMPETYTAVVGEMTALLQEYEHVDGSPTRKANVRKLLTRLLVSTPGCYDFKRRQFGHHTRLLTLLRRAKEHGVSEAHARPRLAELVIVDDGLTVNDGRVLPRQCALTTEEVDAVIQAVTPAVAAPARKAATNWKARALAAEARVQELERPAKRLRAVKTPGKPVSATRSESSKRAWDTIRRNRALKAVAS